MNEQIEILTRVYAYVNRIKVYLAFKDIASIWQVVNELSEYLVSVDCAPTKLALDVPCTCPKFENGSKVFPMRECEGCRKSAHQ